MFIVNVEATIRKKERYLIIKRSEKEEHAGGLLSLVGGKVELEGNIYDILEKTVKREIFEEVNVEVKDEFQYVNSSSFVTDQGDAVVNVVFLCKYKEGEAYPKSEEEVDSVYWLTAEEILAHPNAPEYLKESIMIAEKLHRKGIAE